MKRKSRTSEYARIKLNVDDKDLHGGLVRASSRLFKLLHDAKDTELQLIWRAALAHKIDFTGVVPIVLEDLQKSDTSIKVMKCMIPMIKERLATEQIKDYKTAIVQ